MILDFITRINTIWHVHNNKLQWIWCDEISTQLKEQNLRLLNIKQTYLCNTNDICDFHKFDFIFTHFQRDYEFYDLINTKKLFSMQFLL